ncbi:ABC transporter permease [Amphibacillus sp. MSJ-3]|uniref:ABC transporter permease n=1 Tax=Amphibacillus sp. MSJ-3 TaxID=2841505 RepID=UPI001C0EFBCD|nr:ABC transporter permease [Amphibacillus sp. MSJ-3]MBU5594747.1 ABC transporter permease [Amphibacillus sp. MSJ-3]
MWNLIKKDFLTISRDRSEFLILLVMPMVLITILGFALGSIMFGTVDMDPIPVALIIENDLEQDLEQFRKDLTAEGIPEQAIEQMIINAEEIDPVASLETVLRSPELSDMIDLKENYDQEQAEEALTTDEVLAVITIPEQFSYHTLFAFYFEEETEADIGLFVQDHEQIQATIVEGILTSFSDQYNLELSIAFATEGETVETTISEENFGTITHFSTGKPVSAFQYYTIGMAVMFALYVASTVSSNAFKEKKNHMFARLMMTGERPLNYLLSKVISAVILTLVQLTILFIASTLLFQTFTGTSVEFWVSLAIISFVFSLVIGGLAAFMTAIAIQFNNDAISGFFSGGAVVIFAFLGGSLSPIEQFSPLMRELGNLTPNGAMMTAYLQLIQGFNINDFLPMIYRVLLMAVLFISLAVAIFPKRRLI